MDDILVLLIGTALLFIILVALMLTFLFKPRKESGKVQRDISKIKKQIEE